MNVLDKYKEWSTEDIRLDVQRNTFPYSVLMENIDQDFNIAQLIRSANAFGASKVYHICPKKQYDRRGTVGQHHYTDIQHLKDIAGLKKIKKNFSKIYAVDCNVNFQGITQSLYNKTIFEPNCLFVLGSEKSGISQEMLELCDEMIYIPMYGSVRSLNCASAASIVMSNVSQYFSSLKSS